MSVPGQAALTAALHNARPGMFDGSLTTARPYVNCLGPQGMGGSRGCKLSAPSLPLLGLRRPERGSFEGFLGGPSSC